MEKIIWTEISLESLNGIWEFYANKNVGVADKIIDEIFITAENIRFAEQYQSETLLRNDFRRAVIRHFKIIYRVEKNNLRIIDVFDARQNPNKLKDKLR